PDRGLRSGPGRHHDVAIRDSLARSHRARAESGTGSRLRAIQPQPDHPGPRLARAQETANPPPRGGPAGESTSANCRGYPPDAPGPGRYSPPGGPAARNASSGPAKRAPLGSPGSFSGVAEPDAEKLVRCSGRGPTSKLRP